LRPGPTARAAAVLVVFLALFVVVDRLSVQRPDRTAAAGPSLGSPSTPPPTTGAPSSSHPSTTAPPTTTSTSEPAAATSSTLRSSKGVTVQVLNAVFVPGLAHQVAGMIGSAGYQVVAANTALGTYKVSRIYYTDGHKADAEAFQKRFPAFEQLFPASQAQARLSREIALHVIIGDNYREIRRAR
jgi:LytR cell envelope-related transcriptional attenuator